MRAAAVAGKKFSVRRHIVVDRPLVARELIPGSRTAVDLIARQPERSAAWRLQIVPNRLAVGAKELVAADFSVHRAMVDLSQMGTVGVDQPGSIHEMPGPFVAEHDLTRIGRRTLQMIQPIVTAMNDLFFAGGNVDRKHHHRRAGRPRP